MLGVSENVDLLGYHCVSDREPRQRAATGGNEHEFITAI
jgi:hypothetical protein